jgi:DNA-binding PadR family transcriptional regulator
MELRPLVLAFLEERPLYGYEIVQRARRRGPLDWEEGTIYPLLHKMEGEGLLTSQWRKGPRGKDRKYYALTRRGKTALARARRDWKDITSILMGGRHGYAGGSAP